MTLHDKGFAIVEDCCSPSECDTIISRTASIDSAGSRGLLDHDWCQSLAGSIRNRVAETYREISSLHAVQCTFFNKSQTSNWFVGYHQDRSIAVVSGAAARGYSGWSQKEGLTFVHGPDKLLTQMIAVRLHIDDSAHDNGPLRVIPGSHRNGILSSAATADLLAAADQIEELMVVNRGGLVLMKPLLLHASSKSLAADHRRVLHFLFGPMMLPDGLEWKWAV